MALDCTGDWKARYGTSAYAHGVCTHVELTGESAESTEQAVRDSAGSGLGIGLWRLQQAQRGGGGGKNAASTGGLDGGLGGAPVGGVSTAAIWGIGLVAVGAAWWLSSPSASARRRR